MSQVGSLPDSRRDWSALAAVAVSTTLGIIATWWYWRTDLLLAYGDTMAHLNIARRIFDSRTPGMEQFGTTWLPVPHLLMQPFIYIDSLWSSGLAASIVGLVCFVITATTLFLSIRLLTKQEGAAWLGFIVFVANPNMLYVQSTALLEPFIITPIMASVYFLLRWNLHDSLLDLILAGFLTVVAVGSRYDGWFFAIVAALTVWLVVFLRSRDFLRAQSLALIYVMLPIGAMMSWVVYNWLIFKDPLAFQRGTWSSQTYQTSVAAGNRLVTEHNWPLSILSYTWSVIENAGWIPVALALTGLLIYAASTRFNTKSLVPYLLFAAYPFHIISLWLGQTFVIVYQVTPGYFCDLNVRYGLLLLPALAFFTGYLYSRVDCITKNSVVWALLCLPVLIQAVWWIPGWPFSVVCLDSDEGMAVVQEVHGASEYLKHNYDGGGILIDDSEMGPLITAAGIPMREYIGYFSGTLWGDSLASPEENVRWVVMRPFVSYFEDAPFSCGYGCVDMVPQQRTFEADAIALSLAHRPDFKSNYALAYKDHGIEIYRKTQRWR